MIGAFLSMKFIGGKTWLQALLFWIVILVIGFALSTQHYLGILITLASIGIFILLAHYWYSLSWVKSIVVWFVAFIIDIVIVYLIVLVFPTIVRYWYTPI